MFQKTAFKVLYSSDNVFLTGSAGTGKTYLLNKYIQKLREHRVPLAITASTGIAATHIGGQTIHSWSGLGIKETITHRDLEKIAKRKPVRKRIQEVQVLLIDEISMLSGQTLENLNLILQYFKKNKKPFGGIKVVFSGDFFQLPPVSKGFVSNAEKFAFMAPVWRHLNLRICYLTEQFRQSDDDLSSFLNEIREGEVTDSGYDQLRECLERSQEPVDMTLKLFTHNADVDIINAQELEKLETDAEMFYASGKGSPTIVETLCRSVLAPEMLVLKIGAQVMFVKNNPEAGYFNGTMGTVMGWTEDRFPIVETTEGQEIIVRRAEWTVTDEFGNMKASFSQVPLRLAWAITVHKSQGMTLDTAEMDLSKTFESGQGYVALSRVKSWSGLRLLGCNQTALQLDPLALRADKRFQELSEEVASFYEDISGEQSERQFLQFVFQSGGTSKPMPREKSSLSKFSEKPKKKRILSHEKTKSLLEEGKTLEEIAKERAIKKGSVLSHILRIKLEYPGFCLNSLRPDEKDIQKVQMVITEKRKTLTVDGGEKDAEVGLRVLYEHFDGDYSYDDLRLIRLFLDV